MRFDRRIYFIISLYCHHWQCVLLLLFQSLFFYLFQFLLQLIFILFLLQITNCCGVCSPSTISTDSYGTQKTQKRLLSVQSTKDKTFDIYIVAGDSYSFIILSALPWSTVLFINFVYSLHSFSFPSYFSFAFAVSCLFNSVLFFFNASLSACPSLHVVCNS